MADVFGLDFGTTNSLAAYVLNGRVNSLLEENRPHPSVVWYHGANVIVGKPAKAQLADPHIGVVQDIVRSPKAYLGKGSGVYVGGMHRSAAEVVREIIHHVRSHALKKSEPSLKFDRAVVTIPVALDGRGRRELREAALMAGVHVVQYVHEPLAALYGYIRSQAHYRRHLAELEGKLALVFDWGGGTLDLTLCKFVGGTMVQILNRGDNEVGGDRFDAAIREHVLRLHCEKHDIRDWPEEAPGMRARLLEECERAKITLSARDTANILIPGFLRTTEPSANIEMTISRQQLQSWTEQLVLNGVRNIDTLLQAASIGYPGIALCLATGGLVQMPRIRELLLERFGPQQAPIVANVDRIIAEGAAWIAHDRRELRLAKPLELLQARNTHVTLVPNSVALPTENQEHRFKYGFYCVDPRDAIAHFTFLRPRLPDRFSPADPRDPYGTLSLTVDEGAQPFMERLELEGSIDHDLVAHVKVRSSLANDEKAIEIHALEFGLGFSDLPEAPRPDSTGPDSSRTYLASSDTKWAAGEICVRSNVTARENAWDLVPGEIVQNYVPGYLDPRHYPPEHQVQEYMYYVPCTNCHRTVYEINRDGCDAPECLQMRQARQARDADAHCRD